MLLSVVRIDISWYFLDQCALKGMNADNKSLVIRSGIFCSLMLCLTLILHLLPQFFCSIVASMTLNLDHEKTLNSSHIMRRPLFNGTFCSGIKDRLASIGAPQGTFNIPLNGIFFVFRPWSKAFIDPFCPEEEGLCVVSVSFSFCQLFITATSVFQIHLSIWMAVLTTYIPLRI